MSQAASFRAPFSRFWLSSFLADVGDGVRLAALPVLTANLSHSPTAVAAVVALEGLPWLLLGLGAGALVDRFDLRRLIVAVNAVQAVLLGLLAIAVGLDQADFTLVAVTAFVTGIGATMRDTASQAGLRVWCRTAGWKAQAAGW